MMNEKIKEYVIAHRDEIANTLVELVKIPSIANTEAADKIMEVTGELFRRAGAEVEVNKSYTLASLGQSEHSIGLFSHADVVPAGDGWSMCQPFEGKIIDGDVFGRGAWDDKSAVVISLYTFKIINELGIDMNSRLVSFIGASEETTMQDIKDYRRDHTPPTVSIVLDAGYPVYLGDKGILWIECEKEFPLEDLLELKGGKATNITLKDAEARVRYTPELYAELCAFDTLSASHCGDFIAVSAQGVSAHGANPQGTVNGAGLIIGALLECPSFSSNDKEALSFMHSLLSVYDGTPLGIVSSDSLFGATTATNGIVDVKGSSIKFTLDVRYGSTYTEDAIINQIGSVLLANEIQYKVTKSGAPSAISPDNKYVQACIQAYREHTGRLDAVPKINAGSTYSRYLPNAFETGTTMMYSNISLPVGHGAAHQPNEHISIDGLLGAIEMATKMVIACDRNQ